MLNSTGDRGDPRGTPYDTVRFSEVKGPSFTVCDRFSKKEENQGKSPSATLATSANRVSNSLWSTVSKAQRSGPVEPGDKILLRLRPLERRPIF